MIAIRPCETEEDFAVAADLMAELRALESTEAAKLGLSEQEVLDFTHAPKRDLQEASALRSGRLMLASVDEESVGCIGYRGLEPAVCEMKYLFVRPQFRQHGIGRALVRALIARAREEGYTVLRLETVKSMGSAIRTYERMGFIHRSPYDEIPRIFLPITVFMEKDLSAPD